MHIVITGGAGFLGSRLARELLRRGELTGQSGTLEKITRITLLDVVPASGFTDPRVEVMTGDVADGSLLESAIGPDTASIFHLAAIVSGQAEADFDLGMRINFDATRMILERARAVGNRPRVVFTSSVAVFGGKLPPRVADNQVLMPQSSYGAQKVMGEVLVTDYSRKNFIDGRTLRMPTISVRPGAPNKAASSFASGIIREPLSGIAAVCPVSADTRMWLMSPRRAVENLIHGHELDTAGLSGTRSLSLPGLSVTVGDMAKSLQTVAGAAVSGLIEWREDEAVKRIVNSWPGDFEAVLAKSLGFTADSDFETIIRAYIEDESIKLEGSR